MLSCAFNNIFNEKKVFESELKKYVHDAPIKPIHWQ